MKLGDLIKWSYTTTHDYFSICETQLGIFIKKIDDFDHWVLAEILDNKGTIKIVMVQKSTNPL